MTHPKLVEAMSRPDFYPHRPREVELVQTHISFVFIAGDLVYKVKKAVDFGFLDFTTLAKRKYFCEEELRLNRRLAPHTYLEVAAIGEDEAGALRPGGGRPVEYAVVMKKLPLERMLKKLLAEGKVGPAAMDAVAEKVADFHRKAETGGEIDEIGGIETIRYNHDENFAQTEKYIGLTIARERYDFLRAWVNRFLERERPLLQRRVRDHRIRDCHGDLHAEHICLADGIIIFDCIEFNQRFRYGDVAAEAAFLAMDLDFNGYADHARAFVDAYVRHSGDGEVLRLLDFYRCYYAYVRGKVISFRVDDPHIGCADRDAAVRMAARYFDLALSYAARPANKTLILVAGLMGTGKSVLARALAPLVGAEIIQTDAVRKEMLRIPASEHRYEEFGQGIYSADISAEDLRKGPRDRTGETEDGRRRHHRCLVQRQGGAIAGLRGRAAGRRRRVCPRVHLPRRHHRKAPATRGSPGAGTSRTGDGRSFRRRKGISRGSTRFPRNAHLAVDTSLAAEENAFRVLKKMFGLG